MEPAPTNASGGKSSTWFVYTDWVDRPMLLATGMIKYHGRGLEKCPNTGRQHWQGVINTHKKTTPKHLREWIGMVAGESWLDTSRANNSREILAYCKKDGVFQEDGIFVEEAGFRTDLCTAIAILRHDGIDEVKARCPEVYVKYNKGLEKLEPRTGKRDWAMECWWIWGESDSGKTSFVKKREKDLFILNCPDGRWWDGYNGQEAVLIDDINPGAWAEKQRGFLLRLMDRYEMKVEVKGGFVDFLPKRIYMTANFPLEEMGPPWCKELGVIDPAIGRRIKNIVHLTIAKE
nr:MAG: replication associated protein [Cressdnaviricota sp.]